MNARGERVLIATLEAEFRFCGNKTPATDPPGRLTGAGVVVDDRDLLATVLDPRTKGCGHLTVSETNKAVELLKKEYIEMQLRMDERKLKVVVIDLVSFSVLLSIKLVTCMCFTLICAQCFTLIFVSTFNVASHSVLMPWR